MRSQLRPALVALGLFTLLTGLVYPLVVTGIAQVLFPGRANGSIIVRNGQPGRCRLSSSSGGAGTRAERGGSTPGGSAAHRGPHPGAVGRTTCERPGSQ